MIVVLLTACVLEINDDDQYFTGQSGEACDVCVTGSLSLSTLATIVAEFGDCSRQCGQGFSHHNFVAESASESVSKSVNIHPSIHPST